MCRNVSIFTDPFATITVRTAASLIQQSHLYHPLEDAFKYAAYLIQGFAICAESCLGGCEQGNKVIAEVHASSIENAEQIGVIRRDIFLSQTIPFFPQCKLLVKIEPGCECLIIMGLINYLPDIFLRKVDIGQE